jgi:hypothetical protein
MLLPVHVDYVVANSIRADIRPFVSIPYHYSNYRRGTRHSPRENAEERLPFKYYTLYRLKTVLIRLRSNLLS